MIDVAFAAMEDLSLVDLIADVVANPTPRRVPCEPTPPPTSVAVSEPHSGVFGKFLRRLRRMGTSSTKT
jgi:hypothetical protein